MVTLSDSWYAEPLFDYEYKSYQLLAYSQNIIKNFTDRKFYPYLNELNRHLARIQSFNIRKFEIEESLRREIKEIDHLRANIIREPIKDNSGLMSEIIEILRFAERELSAAYETGRQELASTQQEIQIRPIGIVMSHYRNGYLLFKRSLNTRIYSYNVRYIHRPAADESYKDVVTTFLEEVQTGTFTNYGELKWNLIRKSSSACNAYLVETNIELPQFETLLPLAKQHVIAQVI